MALGLVILGIIVLILLILLFSPAKLFVEYWDGNAKVWLRYLFFRIKIAGYEKKKKKAVKKKPKKPQKEKKEKKGGGLLPESLSGKLVLLKKALRLGGRFIKRLTRRIKIKDIVIDFTVSDEDAYSCALKFGKMNIIVYNAFTYLGYFLRLRKKSISIKCVYNKPKCIYNTSFYVQATPAAVIAAVLALIFPLLAVIIKSKASERRKSQEKAKEENDKKAA